MFCLAITSVKGKAMPEQAKEKAIIVLTSIEQWERGSKEWIARGYIEEDKPSRGWPRGIPIRTSVILKIAFEKREIETLNTIYGF